MKRVLMLDDPRFMSATAFLIEKNLEGAVKINLTLDIEAGSADLYDGKYDMLVIEPFEFYADAVRGAIAGAISRRIPVLVCTTELSGTLAEKRPTSPSMSYALKHGRDYDFYFNKRDDYLTGATANGPAEIVARALGLEYKRPQQSSRQATV
jgi:hypothetical protein